MHRYHDIWNGKDFYQLRHTMQGRTMQNKGQNIQISNVSVSLKPNLYLKSFLHRNL